MGDDEMARAEKRLDATQDAERQWRIVNKVYRLARLMNRPIGSALHELTHGDQKLRRAPMSLWISGDVALERRLDALIREYTSSQRPGSEG